MAPSKPVRDDEASASSPSAASAHCGCPDECRSLLNLPLDRGVLVSLGAEGDDGGGDGDDDDDDVCGGGAAKRRGRESRSCDRLVLRSQEDANLSRFLRHPNVYVPASLLDRPDRLEKFGGGGSGVTVFGGHHPLLGDLVMKHGGPKDLVELVSLAKIEREMGVRRGWKVDRLLGEEQEGRGFDRSRSDHPAKDAAADRRAFSSSDHPANHTPLSPVYALGKRLTHGTGDMAAAATAVHAADIVGATARPLVAAVDSAMGMMRGSWMSADGASERRSDRRSQNLTMRSVEEVEEDDGDGRDVEENDVDPSARAREIASAVEDMRTRIPAFRMIYVSPMHVRERKEELVDSAAYRSRSMSPSECRTPDRPGKAKVVRRHSSVMRKGRAIHLFGAGSARASSVEVRDDHVNICFGGCYRCWEDVETAAAESHACPSRSDPSSDGYASLVAFAEHLRRGQERNEWKVTLGQQTIGRLPSGASAPTASSLLARGELRGPLLHRLIDEEIRVIRNLQLLTMPEEADVVAEVRAEFEDIARRKESGEEVSAADVSSTTNDFVGKAIRKNFHPQKGRFVMLRQFGIDLREGRIHLKPKEVVPAKHLENLFYRSGIHEKNADGTNGRRDGAHDGLRAFEESFGMHARDPCSEGVRGSLDRRPIFDSGLDQWQSLLELSLSMKHKSATERIWTCGLTDGGLHNMFLSESRLWLFDLGEPNLEPIPAFLTKFLMSFFHTLGMEEDEEGDWIVRFEQDDSGRLVPTERTLAIVPKVTEAFNVALDRLVKEVFGGEEEVRVLMLRYVVTQLISDAAFCIEKWRVKGGGDEKRSEHQYFLEKWLWRALWDVYASEEIRRRFLSRMLFRRQEECRELEVSNLSRDSAVVGG